MSDLSDFQASVFNSAKTVVTKVLSNDTNTSADVTGGIGLELTDLEHTITDNVQSVVIIGTMTCALQGTSGQHILRCWRNEIPSYAGGAGVAATFNDTQVGACYIGTDSGYDSGQTASFVLVDNSLGDSTQQRYRWTIKTFTGNSQSRSITLRYLTNPYWDLRNT